MKGFYICFLLLITSISSYSQDVKEENKCIKYKNSVGFDFLNGFSYKRYFSNTAFEYHLNLGSSGIEGFKAVNQMYLYYQPWQDKVFQPFVGPGLMNYISGNDFLIRPGLRLGLEVAPRNTRFSFSLHTQYTFSSPIQGAFDKITTLKNGFYGGVGIKYRF